MKIVIFDLLGRPKDRRVFDKYMERSVLQDGRACHKCTLCGKQNLHLHNVRNHIENNHFPGHFSYDCNQCEKIFKTKTALESHAAREHKDEKA